MCSIDKPCIRFTKQLKTKKWQVVKKRNETDKNVTWTLILLKTKKNLVPQHINERRTWLMNHNFYQLYVQCNSTLYVILKSAGVYKLKDCTKLYSSPHRLIVSVPSQVLATGESTPFLSYFWMSLWNVKSVTDLPSIAGLTLKTQTSVLSLVSYNLLVIKICVTQCRKYVTFLAAHLF